MAIATTPPYTPTPPSITPRTEDGRNIVDWVMRELSKLSVNEGANPRQQMIPISAPPITPREGLIAYADGISWNPNGVGKGIRLFDNTGNPWRAMGAPFGAAGANHIMGLVPDPGAVVHTPPSWLGDDGLFHAFASFATLKIQTFTSSGTYTPSTGIIVAILVAVGSAGAGGGVVGAVGASRSGGGGGSGSLSLAVKTAAQIGVSQTVTIGAAASGVSGAAGGNGNDTSIGALCIGKGGTGGTVDDNVTGTGAGGAGGIAGTGDIRIVGTPGMQGFRAAITSASGSSGAGGGAPLFGGGAQGVIGISSGNPGTAAGGGGSGGSINNSATNAAGGASLAGFAFVLEFCNQ